MPRLQAAVDVNAAVLEAAGAVVEARALPWGELHLAEEVAPDGCDLVLGADLCYNPGASSRAAGCAQPDTQPRIVAGAAGRQRR